MNPQDACVILEELRQQEVLAITGEEAPPLVTEPFPEAGTDDFLSGNLEDFSINMTDIELLDHKLVGILESNAFLASIQKAHEAQNRDRIQNWADVYSQKSRVSSGRGALVEQLRGIGVKVDDEWLTKIFNIGAEEADDA